MQNTAMITDQLSETPERDQSSLVVHVTTDQTSWRSLLFEGESPRYVDQQAAAWLQANPHLIAEIDQENTCWSLFPRTFQAVLEPALAIQPLSA